MSSSPSSELAWPLMLAVVVGAVSTQLIVGASPDLGSGRISEQIRDLFWFCLLCGVFASATIEVIKRLTNMRGRAQLAVTRSWLHSRLLRSAEDLEAISDRLPEDPDGKRSPDLKGKRSPDLPDRALDELAIAMGTTQGRPPADLDKYPTTNQLMMPVFNLQTEQLVAQISRAGDRALAEPEGFPVLLTALMNQPPWSLSRARPDGKDGAEEVVLDVRKGKDDEAQRVRENAFHDSQRVSAGIDQLQIALGEQWRRKVQGTAVWMSGAYGLGFTWAVGVGDAALLYYALAALLIGGALAWFIRDLCAVVERLRRG